jgi:hypothetical protein
MTQLIELYHTLPLVGQIVIWALGILFVLAIIKRLVKLAVLVAILFIVIVIIATMI